MTDKEETIGLLEDSTPLIQNTPIPLLNSYGFEYLETISGKEELREAAQAKISELVRAVGIESVLFTGFVSQ